MTIYRIINELMNNIVKHSQAQRALVQILVNEVDVQLMVEDDGIGMKTGPLHYGIGMKNIQSRVDFLKGEMSMDSNEKGTVIIIHMTL